MSLRDLESNDDPDFWDEVQRDAEERRANPLPFALDSIEELFRYATDTEDGLRRWRKRVWQGMWWADDVLACLDAVLAQPPPDLGTTIHDRGVVVWAESAEGPVHGDAKAHVAWLEATARRMHEIFEEFLAEKRAEQKKQ